MLSRDTNVGVVDALNALEPNPACALVDSFSQTVL
jgi:hypothetical protein